MGSGATHTFLIAWEAMDAAASNGPPNALVVRQVGTSVWILRPRHALEGRLVGVLRDAFLEAVDSGAQQVVVDLSEVEMIAPQGAATLVAMADHVLARKGAFWLAATWLGGTGPALRAIEEHGPDALRGLSPALDSALEELAHEKPAAVAIR